MAVCGDIPNHALQVDSAEIPHRVEAAQAGYCNLSALTVPTSFGCPNECSCWTDIIACMLV